MLPKSIFILFILLITQALSTPIEHVVVLMLENRSFDHMTGFLRQNNSNIDGCLPHIKGCFNPDIHGKNVNVSNKAQYVVNDNGGPWHSCTHVLDQIYGFGSRKVENPPMTGFIKSYENVYPGHGSKIMECFSHETVPAISTLANEFMILDRWFSSIPGPTLPNRMYALSATSYGFAHGNRKQLVNGLPQKTIMETLDENNKTWRNYFGDVPAMLLHKY